MTADLATFAKEYVQHIEQRAALSVPPLPLSPAQTESVCAALGQAELDAAQLKVHGQDDTVSSLRYLLAERVPPGVYPASEVKAGFLGAVALGTWSAGKETFFSAIIRDITKQSPGSEVASG